MLADLIFLQFIICPSPSQHLRASDTSPERRKKYFVKDERRFLEFSTPWAPAFYCQSFGFVLGYWFNCDKLNDPVSIKHK